MIKPTSTAQRSKLAVLGLAVLIGVFGLSGIHPFHHKAQGSASGPATSHTGAPGEISCVACHGQFPVNSGGGNIVISGLPAYYRPGAQYPVTLTVSDDDGVNFGFQMTALNPSGSRTGSYTLPTGTPPEMQLDTGFVNSLERRYLSHTINGITPTQFGSKSWTFTWNAPLQNVGPIGVYASGNAANSDGGPNGDQIYTTKRILQSGPSFMDLDGDGKTDVSVFRPNGVGGSAEWWYLRSSDGGNGAFAFGSATDTPAPADYTGDGKTDVAFWRPSTGEWYVIRSEDNTFFAFPFGSLNDVPMPADYDGDGSADATVFRPSANLWFTRRSSDGQVTTTAFGSAGDVPVAADYDGDGKADIAIYRPNGSSGGGEWWYLRSSDGVSRAYAFGSATDTPIPADYTGDGKADIAIWRPSVSGEWYILRSEDDTFYAFPFGVSTDILVPGDYDGDGKTDAAVFRPAHNIWYAMGSTAGIIVTQFGAAGDKPLANSYIR